MLRSLLVDLIAADPEVEVVDESQAESSPDVVLISAADPENRRLPLATLMALPRARVLMFGNDGRRASLWELRPHQTPLGELSAHAIAECLKSPKA